ncbi:glycine/betaine ABC transporter substrate-binding protein [Tersicoccus solisilvae]|uniref:Glycine/betaine ABC transporter substrate-binding protein n=1 Tax=Tersicoccus solisilvae TaxID=1882339 RepID=A0ABQ1NI59_9MICC|nr:glycine betaine ABC transporter substrate-binding protein [Tersicoccus solisilvae]GGC77858.1 glycine/betaine ABC transporter substrate-binding protein [Tersicoccus solisilvae]
MATSSVRARGRRRLRAVVTAAVLTLTLGVSGCGLAPATSFVPDVKPGSIRPIEGLPVGTGLTVTSKNFTEQLILGKIAVIAARAAGFDVQDLTNVPGSQPVRQLMLDGQADLTYEYTGTAWLTYLGKDKPIPDQRKQWQAVKDADTANGLTWGPPAPMNNTYAFAIRSAKAKQLGVTSLSDIATIPPAERTFCIEAEFNSRPDGMNPLLKTYGIPRGSGVPNGQIGIYDTGAVYTATANGDCNFGEVFTTDGRIKALDLTVLADDKKYFPAYNVSPVYNTKTLEEHPQLAQVFDRISPKLTDAELQELNLQVDVQGREPADVAADWMVKEGFVTR